MATLVYRRLFTRSCLSVAPVITEDPVSYWHAGGHTDSLSVPGEWLPPKLLCLSGNLFWILVSCAAREVLAGMALGMVMQLPDQDDETSVSRRQLLAKLDVCMGGRVAEELIFGESNITTGAHSCQGISKALLHACLTCMPLLGSAVCSTLYAATNVSWRLHALVCITGWDKYCVASVWLPCCYFRCIVGS